MILLAHATTGAIIGLKIHNPILVIVISFVSHFILDRLPHWNYDVPKDLKNNKSKKKFFYMLPDIIPTVLVYLVFVFAYPQSWLIISIGVAFAILPDFLSLSWYIPKIKKIMLPFLKFHKKIQWEISDKHNKPLWGILSQTIYLSLLIFIFLKF